MTAKIMKDEASITEKEGLKKLEMFPWRKPVMNTSLSSNK
jgi:hypothetical protein